jgi:hypothetical protein
LERQRFIAPSAGGIKKRLRGIESGSRMIYNESNKGSRIQFLGLSFVVFGEVQTKRAVQFPDSPFELKIPVP